MCSGISHDVLIRVDAQRRILAVNPECTRTLRTTGGELVGSSLLDLLPPEERDQVAARLAGEPSPDIDLRVRLRVGADAYHGFDLRWARDAAGQLTLAGRATATPYATKQSDLLLASIADCTHDYVVVTDADLNIIYANREPEEVARAGGMIGMPMLALAVPAHRDMIAGHVERVMKTGELVVYDSRAQFPDGSVHDFRSRLGPVRAPDNSGRVIGVVLITRDITVEVALEEAKRNAEQMLREYMVQLERSNSELERFASIASHDLQEPLRKIQAFSDRLRDRFMVELPEPGRDYLERIRSAAKRMQDLINDLLMFSRLSAKGQTYSRVALTKVARSVLSDLEVRVEETGGKVNLGELPSIDADPIHMRQLLQNLIGNALKFSRPGVPPVVDITGEVVPGPGGEGPMLRLVVADNGIGIEPRHHDRIFGIFERLHGRGKYEGTGVGLAVCRKIVEQHHGSITVTSVIDEGTTFTILLPIKQQERSQKS
jgi:PAS domain S-box-containing protein